MSRRVERAEELVREEASRLLLFKTKDPRLKTVSITRVKMTPDLRRATLYYSVFDDTADRNQIKAALAQATPFFRREIGRALALKFVPEMQFEFDRSLEYAQHMDQVLAKLKPDPAEPAAPNPEREGDEDDADS